MVEMFCTPDGSKFFNNEDELLQYVKQKCGTDIFNFLSGTEEFFDILGDNSPWDYLEALETYDNDKASGDLRNPVLELKRLREIKTMFGDLLQVYIKLYKKL